MNTDKRTGDKRKVLLDALLRYADQCGDADPHFYKDEMLEMLGVCDHVFNIMLMRLGDRCCRLVDNFDGRTRYAIDVGRCFELRDRMAREEKEVRKTREGLQITVLATLIGVFFAIVLGF